MKEKVGGLSWRNAFRGGASGMGGRKEEIRNLDLSSLALSLSLSLSLSLYFPAFGLKQVVEKSIGQ